jgi:Icc protein
MFDLAHVTDLHLVESNYRARGPGDLQRLYFLSAGRRIDAEARSARALLALRAAGRNAAHVVVTGDLTEDGTPAQFELLAELLERAGLAPERVTLVPGNHDRYTQPDAYEQALCGPLRAYAASSCAGRVIELGREAWLLPVSTSIPQSVLRSAGRLSDADLERIQQLAKDARRARKLALVAQHHPPHGFGSAAWNWIDGMLNAAVGRALLGAHSKLHILHGHTHKHSSEAFAPGRPPQAHSGAAVVARADNVRFYQITREALLPVAATRMPLLSAEVAPALA